MNGCCDDQAPTVPPPQAPVSWCAGNNTYTYANGRVTVTPRLPAIVDGTYPNATVTVVGGCITALQSGTNVVYSACDPCVVPPPAPPTVTVPIDGNACNLSTFSPIDGLLTLLSVSNSACIALSGCGNAGDPLVAEPIISADAGNALECRPSGLFVPDPSATTGVNFVGCGITITNGVWTSIPLPFAPILGLTSTDGSVLFTNAGCVWDLSAVANPTDPTVAQAIVVDLPADLPATPTGTNGFGIVGAANPRALWIFVNALGWREVLDSTSTSLRINF